MRYFDPTSLGLDVRKVSGDEAYCVCPYHDDHSPSASFNMESGKFICYVCHVSPNVFQIAKDLGGDVLKTTLPKITEFRGDSELSLDWEWVLTQKVAKGNSYLASRGLTTETIEKLDIREFSKGVAFILRNPDGQPVGAQLRFYDVKTKARYLFIGEKPPLWPMHLLGKSGSDYCIMVEGVFGVANAMTLGFKNVFSCLGSQSASRSYAYLKGYKKKFIVFDDDNAGHAAATKILYLDKSFRAYIPGAEADEEPYPFFNDLINGKLDTASYYNEFMEASGVSWEVQNVVQKFILKSKRR